MPCFISQGHETQHTTFLKTFQHESQQKQASHCPRGSNGELFSSIQMIFTNTFQLISYMVCWLPYAVASIVEIAGVTPTSQVSEGFFVIFICKVAAQHVHFSSVCLFLHLSENCTPLTVSQNGSTTPIEGDNCYRLWRSYADQIYWN